MVNFGFWIMLELLIDNVFGMQRDIIENKHMEKDQRVEFFIQDLGNLDIHLKMSDAK